MKKTPARSKITVIGVNLTPSGFLFHGLMKKIDSVLKETAIYVDANLANGLHGRDVTKDLYDKGFKNIYLATGSHPEEFTDLWWVIDVIGKEPPFLGMVGKS